MSKVDNVTFSSKNDSCSFDVNSSTICTFENFVTQLNVTCKGAEEIHLTIEKPNIIENREELNSSFIMVPLAEGEEAVLTLKIDTEIAEIINKFQQ